MGVSESRDRARGVWKSAEASGIREAHAAVFLPQGGTRRPSFGEYYQDAGIKSRLSSRLCGPSPAQKSYSPIGTSTPTSGWGSKWHVVAHNLGKPCRIVIKL